MRKLYLLLLVGLFSFIPGKFFDNTAQTLPFSQNWNTTTLITANDNWSGVPGIEGYLGQDITTSTAVDPQTLLTTSSVANDLDVIANQTNPNTNSSGGVAEFDGIANPSIALQGSGTADAPNIIINLNTTGLTGINVAYNVRDLDGSTDNAVQAVALQYRVGNTGNFTNIPAGFVADATSGPSLATLVTPVSATLPGAADNQPLVQVRIITSNAAGSDEWVGIDDIAVTSGVAPTNSVTTGAVATAPFCIDATTPGPGTVAFTATGTFNTTFTAYLSDASGDFGSPVNIGSTAVNGTDPSGTINITIPAGTASGTGYKIRVDAMSPAVTGSESAAFEIINGAKNVSNASAAPGSGVAVLFWSNPNACYDEIMIVAKETASISGTPTGDGTAYTASNAFGSGTAFDGGFVVYKGTVSPQTITGLTNGTTYNFKLFTRKGTNWSTGVEVSTTPNVQPAPGEIVINQFSPDYAGASDEYVQIVNKTNSTFDLAGLAIRYQSASGSSGSAGGNLSGTLQGKKFWLLSPNATVTAGMTNNLARDGAITAGFAAANGQLALVRISDGVVIDALGYGTLTGGTYSETAAAPNPPADGGLRRVTNGADTDNNSVDFTTVDNADILLTNNSGNALPVKFSNVKAVEKAGKVEVSWTNASEENVISYSVERSSNGRSFDKVGEVSARSNNNGRADYSFIDASPASGNNFYRVKAVETTGKFIYTNIVRINTAKNSADLVVYPNPAVNELSLQFSNLPAGNYVMQLVNTGGQTVASRSYVHAGGSVTETISITNLPKGVYSLQVNGLVRLQKQFIKQ